MIAERDYADGIERFFADRLQLVKPELSRMTVSEWAEAKRILPRGLSSMPGPFRWSVTPYLREIADCFSESSPVQRIAIMKGSRIGATVGVLENALGYLIDKAPAPILFISGDKESAENAVEIRIDRMIESAGLGERVFSQSDKKANKKTGDTKAKKEFPGGFLLAMGPNVAAKLRSFGARYIFFDEVNAFPQETEAEGDPITLATRRSDEYERNRKIAYISTPIDETTSRIKPLFEAGDQRYYFVPCIHCGHFQRLQWRDADGNYRLKYDLDAAGHLDEKSVHYECGKCGKPWRNSDKAVFLPLGVWRATAEPEEPGFRSYHLSSLYSPVGMRTWTSICREWIKTKGDATKLKPFITTVLGETWIEKGEAPSFEKIMLRRDEYLAGTLPAEAKAFFCTAAADIQDDRIECEIVAWGRDKESWSVEYLVFHGKTEFVDSEPWRELAAALKAKHAGLPIMIVAIDSKHWTRSVYQFCESMPQNVYPLAGDNRVAKTGRIFMLKKVEEFSTLRRIDLYAHELKTELYSYLRMGPPEPSLPFPAGYCHFPSSYGDRYFKMLVSEEFVKTRTRTGAVLMLWRTMHGRRNEAHDCRIYNMAALLVLQGNVAEEVFQREITTTEFWDYVEAQLGGRKIAKAGESPRSAAEPADPNQLIAENLQRRAELYGEQFSGGKR